MTGLDAAGKAVYNSAGELEESTISSVLDASLKDRKIGPVSRSLILDI